MRKLRPGWEGSSIYTILGRARDQLVPQQNHMKTANAYVIVSSPGTQGARQLQRENKG